MSTCKYLERFPKQYLKNLLGFIKEGDSAVVPQWEAEEFAPYVRDLELAYSDGGVSYIEQIISGN